MIYISGAITGCKDFEQKFAEAESKLTKNQGDCVVNPCKLSRALPNYPNLPHESYMCIDMAALSICDTVYMLKGWEGSKGENIEHDWALENGLEIIYEG